MSEEINNKIIEFSHQQVDDDFKVVFDVNCLYAPENINEEQTPLQIEKLSEIELLQHELVGEIEELDGEIDRLTNKSDKLDYTIAVGCGVLCGLIDSFFVGAFDFEGSLEEAKNKVNSSVEKLAEKTVKSESIEKAIERAKEKAAKQGSKLTSDEIRELREKVAKGVSDKFASTKLGDPERALRLSISKLERTFHIPSDSLFKGVKGINEASHHLDDLAHHPTFLGMLAAIFSVFLKCGFFTDKNGKFRLRFNGSNWKDYLKDLWPVILSGLLTFILYYVHSKKKEEIDAKIPKPIRSIMVGLAQVPMAVKVLEIINNWLGHLASDMAGSKATPGAGMGIPGFFVSILKEVSSIYPLNKSGLPKLVDNIYTKNRFDMRHELAAVKELGRQAIPVLIGEFVVRLFYFIRRLMVELSDGRTLKDVNWENVIPFNNRTIARMITIESGTFTAIDIADAAIRSAIKNGSPYNPLFWKDIILRVNFVGVGRFSIAVATDVSMGVKRDKLIKRRLQLNNKQLELQGVSLAYANAGIWEEAKSSAEAIIHMEETATQAIQSTVNSIKNIISSFDVISTTAGNLAKDDPEFGSEMSEILS